MTRRERMERQLDRRLDWARERDRKASAGFARAHNIADNIPLGQPILVGHHSEGHARRDIARIDAGMRQGVESSQMAAHHRSKAAGIGRQLDRSIFSDDPDAPERLRERIAELEAKRDARKRANAAFKRGGIEAVRAEVGDEMALEGATTLRLCPWHKVPYPPYSLSNLGANIRRLRNRLDALEPATRDTLPEGRGCSRLPTRARPGPLPGDGLGGKEADGGLDLN